MVFLESPQIKTLIVNLILFLGFISNSNAQSDTCALIDLEAINGSKGDEICIQVKISNFKNVLSFQFPINFDPSVVQPVYVRNLYNLIGFSDQDINATKAFEGAIRVVWTNPNGDTITLPDTVLFEICFKIVGKPGDCSNIEMTNWPISSEIIQRDVNGNDTAGCIIDKNPFDQIKVSVPSHLCVSNSSCGTLTNTGNIIIKAWGGLAPYTVMSNNSIPPTNIILTKPGDCAYITNQAAGTYDFKVTDQNGEDSIFSVVISKTSSLVISNDISYTLDPVCWNKANGRVGINIIGGSGNYFIKWLPFNRYGIKRINGLLPGKYTVVVRDTNGCEEMKDFILRSDTLKGELTIDNRATCFGFCNGKATIKATGGTPFLGRRYEFVWSMHSIADCPIDTICHNDSLCGDQFVVIKDSRGCKDTIDFIIPFSGNLTDSLIIDSVLCFGDQNGRITAFVQSPSPLKQPIVFELRDASNNIIMGGLNFGAQYQSPGLGAGTYFLTTTDSVGCFHIDTIKIFQPAILDYLENQIDTTESCNPGGDALLDVRGVGGTQPYSYSWSNGEKTNRNSNLTLGTYTLTITDAHLCTITKTYTVSKPVGPTITGFNNKDVNCLGDTSGCVEVLFTQGSSPVIINWNFGGGNNSRICQLGAGTYTVTLTDQSGCSDTASTTINTGTNSILIDSFVLVNPSCPGKSDGLIIVFAKGGSGLLTYAWNNGITTLVNASIKAGSYIVTVDDIGGCPGITDTFNLVDRPKPSIQVNTIIEPSCAETASCDASALVTVNTSDSIVVVSWSSGEQKRYVSKSGTFQDTAKNLCSGRQYAIISVNDLCSDTVFFDIKIPPRISLDSNQLSLTKPSCYGRKDGSISIAAKGGCTPYIYNWTNPVITGPTLNNVGDGFYRVKITDCRGCVHFDSVRLRQPDTIRVQVILGSTFDVSCPGKQDGKITLVWNGGSGGTGRFNWNPNVGTDSVLTNLSAGTYTVTITDRNNCTGSASVIISEPAPMQIQLSPIDTPKCKEDQAEFSVLQAQGGLGPVYKFTIDDGPPNDIGDFVPLFSGSYKITVYDRNGCTKDTSIVVPDLLNDLSLEFGKDFDTIQLGDSVLLDGVFNSISVIDSFLWSPIRYVSTPNSNTSFVTPGTNTTFVLTLVDVNGCRVSDKINIIVENIRRFFAPNVISPNSDNTNDFLEFAVGSDVMQVDLVEVYDRWGGRLYSIEKPNINGGIVRTWDGRSHNEFVVPGVYVYLAKVRFKDGNVLNYGGDITVLR